MLPRHQQINCLSVFIPSLHNSTGKKIKQRRIKLSTLQKSKIQRGRNAPNFFFDYLANQLQYLTKWIHQTDYSIPMKQSYCNNISLSDLPFLNTTIKQHPCFKNTVISTALTTWWKVVKIFHSSPTPCKHTPVCLCCLCAEVFCS